MPGPWQSCGSRFSDVLLFVRPRYFEEPDDVDCAAAGATYYYVFRSPALEPCSPNKPSNLRLRRSEACYRVSSALLAVPYTISPGLEGDFICKISVLTRHERCVGGSRKCFTARCRDQARFTRYFDWLDDVGSCTENRAFFGRLSAVSGLAGTDLTIGKTYEVKHLGAPLTI
jgi:hypothetical protein